MNDDKLTPMQRIAYDTICEIVEMKRGNVEPCMAHIRDIRNYANVKLTEALRELSREGIIGCNLDIAKNPMYSIKQPQ